MSYYKLTIECDPGGQRFHGVWRLRTLKKIKQELVDCLSSYGLNLFCWYGVDINLEIYEDSAKTHTIDLRNYIHILIDRVAIVGYDNEKRTYHSPSGKKFILPEDLSMQNILFDTISHLTSHKYRELKISDSLDQMILGANPKFINTDFWIPEITDDEYEEIDPEHLDKINEKIDVNSSTNHSKKYPERDKSIDKYMIRYSNFKIFINYQLAAIPKLTGKRLSRKSEKYGYHSYE